MRLSRGTAIAVMLLLTASLYAQTTVNGTGQAEFVSQSGDLVGQGQRWTLDETVGSWRATIDDTNNDGTPETVRIAFSSTQAFPIGPFWGWEFNSVDLGTPLTPGTYLNAMRASRTEPGRAGMAVIGDGAACLTLDGQFTITELEFCSFDRDEDGNFILILTRFNGSFEQHCEQQAPALTGTVTFDINPDELLEGGNCDAGGGGDTPTVPPPPFQISLPTDFDVDPVNMSGVGTQSFQFTTAVTGDFNADLHLAVETDALEHEDFHATITPSVIPAPGAGEGQLTITTGPLTFPRVYSVKLIATANDQVFSRTILVQVSCDPPTILGTNQPKSITAANGSQVTLEVTPNGTGPFFYQWYKGVPGMTRSPVLAANESKLIFTTRETATYWVRVSNACGTVNSGPATVTTTGTLSGPARRRGGG